MICNAKVFIRASFIGACLFGATTQLHAQTVCNNNTGSAWVDGSHQNNGNWYTFWSQQSGNCGASQLILDGNGQYEADWNLSSNSDLVVGVGWQTGSLTRSIGYYFGKFNPGSNAYLSLYGWSSNGDVNWLNNDNHYHVEYYIVQGLGPYNPAYDPGMMAVNYGNPVYVDGSYYMLYVNYKYGPSYYSGGSEWFYQFWAIPQNPISAPTGVRTLNFGAFVQAWSQYGGMHLNSADGYQVMATEGYGSSGSSNGTVWYNY